MGRKKESMTEEEEEKKEQVRRLLQNSKTYLPAYAKGIYPGVVPQSAVNKLYAKVKELPQRNLSTSEVNQLATELLEYGRDIVNTLEPFVEEPPVVEEATPQPPEKLAGKFAKKDNAGL